MVTQKPKTTLKDWSNYNTKSEEKPGQEITAMHDNDTILNYIWILTFVTANNNKKHCRMLMHLPMFYVVVPLRIKIEEA